MATRSSAERSVTTKQSIRIGMNSRGSCWRLLLFLSLTVTSPSFPVVDCRVVLLMIDMEPSAAVPSSRLSLEYNTKAAHPWWCLRCDNLSWPNIVVEIGLEDNRGEERGMYLIIGGDEKADNGWRCIILWCGDDDDEEWRWLCVWCPKDKDGAAIAMSHKNREASLYIMVLVSYLQSVGLRCDDDDMTRRGVGRVRGRWAYLSICNWTLSEGKPK